MFNVVCELSQPMGKIEFSSTVKNRTDSVSQVGKGYVKWDHVNGEKNSDGRGIRSRTSSSADR